MVILEPPSFSLGNVSYLRVWAVLVQVDGLNSALNLVVKGDIVLTMNKQCKHIFKYNLCYMNRQRR